MKRILTLIGFVAMMTFTATQEARAQRYGIGAALGYVKYGDVDWQLAYGGRFQANIKSSPATVGFDFLIFEPADYLRDFMTKAWVRFEFNHKGAFRPYIGVGFSYHYFALTVGSYNVGVDNAYGVHGLGGLHFQIAKMLAIFAEADYGMIFTDPDSTTQILGTGGVMITF